MQSHYSTVRKSIQEWYHQPWMALEGMKKMTRFCYFGNFVLDTELQNVVNVCSALFPFCYRFRSSATVNACRNLRKSTTENHYKLFRHGKMPKNLVIDLYDDVKFSKKGVSILDNIQDNTTCK